MRPSTLVVQNLTIRYESFTAVDALSFSVQEGEIFGLLGPNGAGKTTTFLSLTKQIPIYAGRISLLGYDLQKDFDHIKPLFGYVPDAENHIDEFTATQNLALFADLYGVSRSRIEVCLRAVELWREKDLPVRAFSRGMRKKLLLARALLHQPRLLLLDEPTANLDVHSTALIRQLLQQLTKEGVTVLVTTHDMPEVEQICDRVAIINHGKLVDLDAPIVFKSRNTERIVDVVLERGEGHEKLSLNLHNETERKQLARLLDSEIPLTLHTREFDFYQAFLRLTGEEYR